MQISLKEITMANFLECINLRVREDQRGFVAPNVFSLAEAKADGVSNPLAIYADETMVGFIMYCFDSENGTGHIDRLMVDQRYQGYYHGKTAMIEVIERLRKIRDCQRIQTSFAHANAVADALYASLGFRRTGEVTSDGKETVVILET